MSILILGFFFLSPASLWEARQGISHSISLFLIIIDTKVVSKEVLRPTDLTRAQAFCIHESTKVIVVSRDKDLVFAVFEVVATSFKSFNNSQELLIVSLIPSLSVDKLLREKGSWMLLANFRLREIGMIFVAYVIRKKLIPSHLTKNFPNNKS